MKKVPVKQQSSAPAAQNGVLKIVRYFFGIMYLIGAVMTWIVSPIFAICYFLAALICLPPTAKWIFEKIQIPNWSKFLAVIILLLVPNFVTSQGRVQPGGEVLDLNNTYQARDENRSANDSVIEVFGEMEQGVNYVSQAINQTDGASTVKSLDQATAQFKHAKSTLAAANLPPKYVELEAKLNATFDLFIAAIQDLSNGVITNDQALQKAGTAKFGQAVNTIQEERSLGQQLR